VNAGWYCDNPASGRVLEKLGCKRNGEEKRACLDAAAGCHATWSPLTALPYMTRRRSHEFLDSAKVYIKSGAGGNGCVSFRREKFIGVRRPQWRGRRARRRRVGRGGREPQHADRLPFPAAHSAKNGGNGMGKEMAGANGPDAVVKVPVGTQIYEEDNETLIADLDHPGARVMLLKGGNGGFGNAHFKSSPIRRRVTPIPASPRKKNHLAAAEADRRCRIDRPAQCREIDLSRARVRGENRRSPTILHHAQSAARYGARLRHGLCRCRSSRSDRGCP
jgi:hypothetical protein